MSAFSTAAIRPALPPYLNKCLVDSGDTPREYFRARCLAKQVASPHPVPKTSPEPSRDEAALKPPSTLPPQSRSLCPQMHWKFDSATCSKSCNSFAKSFPCHLLGFGLSPWHLPLNGVRGKGHPCATAAAGYKSPSRGGCAHVPFLPASRSSQTTFSSGFPHLFPRLILALLFSTALPGRWACAGGARGRAGGVEATACEERDDSVARKCRLTGEDAASARNLPWLVTRKRCCAAQPSPRAGSG